MSTLTRGFRRGRYLMPFVMVAVLLLLLIPTTSRSQTEGQGGKPGNSYLLPTVPLTQSYETTVKGDYVAGGIGMRNIGSGTIIVSLPQNSTIVKAFLYWAVIRTVANGQSPNTGNYRGQPISGTLIGSSGSPCWTKFNGIGVPRDTSLIDVYRCDVTELTALDVNGITITAPLTGFPSTLTGGQTPAPASEQGAPTPFPYLLEGASLVVVFQNVAFDYNKIIIKDGAVSFANHLVDLDLGSHTAAIASVTDNIAQATYIIADGQLLFLLDKINMNSQVLSGPGGPIFTDDGVRGVDGITAVNTNHGLWDTFNADISNLLAPGVATILTPTLYAAPTSRGSFGDCLTWCAQVLSVKTDIDFAITGPSPVCQNEFPEYHVTVPSNLTNYPSATVTWSFVGNANGAQFVDASHVPIIGTPTGASVIVDPGTGNFTVKATMADGAFEKSATVPVTVNLSPAVSISGPASVYVTTSHQYTATSSLAGVTYAWSFVSNTSGAFFSSATDQSTVSVNAGAVAGTFQLLVEVTKTSTGCVGTALYTVTVNPGYDCGECGEHLLLAEDRVMFNGQLYSEGKIHSNDEILVHYGNPSTHVGLTTAVGNISIQKYNTMDGDVLAGGNLTLHQPVTITGAALDHQLIPYKPLPVLNFTAGGSSFNIPQYGSQTVSPGSYGWVKAYKYATVTFNAGTYYFDKLEFDKGVQINIDVQNGPVTINVVTKLDFDKENVNVNVVGGSSRLLTWQTRQTTPLEFDKNSRLYGTFIAPDATVRMKWAQIYFKGGICAERIDIHKDCWFAYHTSTIPMPKMAAEGSSEQPILAAGFALQNYPNPFNPNTSISYMLPQDGSVSLIVTDVLGRTVRTLVNDAQFAGTHMVTWDGMDDAGQTMPSGSYFARLVTSSGNEVIQMTLAK
jgi:hypothetical protein